MHLIPLEAGARLVIDEIQHGDAGPGPVEVVVLADPRRRPSGAPRRGSRRPPAPACRPEAGDRLPPHGRPGFAAGPGRHVIDGHAVLPMAMILEWLAEGAVHRNPGLVVRGVDNLRLFKGVILGDREPGVVDVAAGKAVRDGDEFRRAGRAAGHAGERPRGHPRAGRGRPGRPARGRDAAARSTEPLPRYSLPRDEIYGRVLFHGPAMQGIERVEGCGERGDRRLGRAPRRARRSGSSGRCDRAG